LASNDLIYNILFTEVSTALTEVGTKLEALSLKIDELSGKKANIEVKADTDKATRSLDLIHSRWQAIAAAVVAGSPLIGAAIEGGVATAMVAVAVVAQKSNQDIKDAYTGLWQDVVGTTKGATNQLVPVLVDAAHSIDASFQTLGPQMSQAMAAAAPAIVTMTRGLNDAAHNAMPGLITAAQRAQPVMTSLANLMGTLGTVFSNTLTSLSQHSEQFAAIVNSLGAITTSVFGLATQLINDLGVAYAANADQIDSAIASVAQLMGQLATGVVPILTIALRTAAEVLTVLSNALGPVAPVLGAVAAAVLITKVAFNGVESAITSVVGLYNKTAEGAVGLSNKFRGLSGDAEKATDSFSVMSASAKKQAIASAESEVATTRSAKAAADARVEILQAAIAAKAGSVSEEQLAAARGVATAAAVAETEATEALAAAEKEAAFDAGPIGWAILGVATLLSALTLGQGSATESADHFKSSVDSLTAAFEQSHGVVDDQVVSSLKATDAYKDAAAAADKAGIGQDRLTNAVAQGGDSLEGLRRSLEETVAAHGEYTEAVGETVITSNQPFEGATAGLDAEGQAAQDAVTSLNKLIDAYHLAKIGADQNERSTRAVAEATATSGQYQEVASTIARTLGLSLDTVTSGFADIIGKGGASAASVQAVAFAFEALQLKVSQAQTAISDHFKEADQAVAEAQNSVQDASHSYQKSAEGVVDAQHSVTVAARGLTQAHDGVATAAHGVDQAHRALQDAYAGVTAAEENYTKSQVAEEKAQRAVNEAREQAVRDLKELHLQLEDQVVAEESANLRLFEQQQNAAGFGITGSNAKEIAARVVTAGNVDLVKAAIDLVSAENAVNDSLNKGTNLRSDVAKADAAGVAGAKNVVSAEEGLRTSQDQVRSSAVALTKAHQQVQDATYSLNQAEQGLSKAHQAVTDAAYNLNKAHMAVQDAEYARERSAHALKAAQDKLSDAQDNASRSLDINTKAGQGNLGLVLQLWQAIQDQGGPAQEQYKRLIDDVAKAFGISTDAAQEYINKINRIDPNFKFGITSVAGVDLSGLPNVWQAILGQDQPGTQSGMSLSQLLGIPGHATGGPIVGPGGPRDDDVLIRASAGEYMQPADTVAYYGLGFMDDVRHRRIPRGGDGAALISGYRDGGQIVRDQLATVGRLSALNFNYVTNVTAMDVMGFPHPPLPPKYVPPAIPAIPQISSVPGHGDDASASAQQYAASQLSRYGWGPEQMGALLPLWTQESNWHWWALNKSSGAYGIPQSLPASKMASAGPDWQTNPATQINWGLGYIKGRYGSPAGAEAHERAFNWYGNGDIVSEPTVGVLGESGPEVVLPLSRPGRASQLAKRAGIGDRHYHLTVYNAANNEVNLRAQFKRMEIESGML
jgi:hypothetical protein